MTIRLSAQQFASITKPKPRRAAQPSRARKVKSELTAVDFSQTVACHTFVLLGAPRTKKNSRQHVQVRGTSIPIPSKAHAAWFANALQQVAVTRFLLGRAGIRTAIMAPVGVKALFYRDRDANSPGDLCGYMEALGDWLQSPALRRNGAGIIGDDRQIVSWDGTRLFVDRERPRIEVTLTIFGLAPSAAGRQA